jgi:hypothetical protein
VAALTRAARRNHSAVQRGVRVAAGRGMERRRINNTSHMAQSAAAARGWRPSATNASAGWLAAADAAYVGMQRRLAAARTAQISAARRLALAETASIIASAA